MIKWMALPTLTIWIYLLFLASLSYLANITEDQGFFFNPLIHLVLASLSSLLFYGSSLLIPGMRQHWQTLQTQPAWMRWFDRAFFFVFVPFLFSIPVAHGLNRHWDQSPGELSHLAVVEHRYQRKGVLETRRCHLNVQNQELARLKIKYRPIDGRCIFNQSKGEIQLLRRPGRLGKPWVQLASNKKPE